MSASGAGERNEETAPEIESTPRRGGQWSSDTDKTSRKDLMVIGSLAFCATAVVAVIIAVVAASGNNDSSSSQQQPTYYRPQEAITMVSTPQEKLDIIRTALGQYNVTAPYLSSIPADASAVGQAQFDDPTAAPEMRAASWLLYKDMYNQQLQVTRRFALAAIYYATSGDKWNNKDGWLSESTSHCNWYGVWCAGARGMATAPASFMFPIEAVLELDFHRNNLQGTIPDFLVLLDSLVSLMWSYNKLTGPFNEGALTNMPNLVKIFLQNNQLSGTIPETILRNGKVDTIYLQINNFTGSWPPNTCRSCVTCDDGIPFFGVDCNVVSCPLTCCDRDINCFYPHDEVLTNLL